MEKSNRMPVPPGVMDAGYAQARSRPSASSWRYRVRARVAVQALLERAASREDYRILDLGAADGLTLLEMRRLIGGTGQFHGVELSEELLSQAPSLPPDTTLHHGDVSHLPESLERHSFDLCTALAVLEHLPDPAACLAEAACMLRPGGVLVVTCPRPIWDDIAGHLGLVADEHHEQRMTRQKLVDLFHAAGFERVSYRPFMWAPVGLLTYARVAVPPSLALGLDDRVRRLRVLNFGFVNQVVVGQLPST